VRLIYWIPCCPLSNLSPGLVHISNIQVGARANSAADLLSRGQPVKIKVMSVAGNRIGLSMKDVDQTTGRDLTPHLGIKSEAELIEEERERATRASTGTNALPLGVKDSDGPVRSAKRLTSPERRPDPNIPVPASTTAWMERTPYRSLVGTLNYLAVATRLTLPMWSAASLPS
jgi:predicted RNA-binding protein with RPS1 domain